jgi:hypothetical protein
VNARGEAAGKVSIPAAGLAVAAGNISKPSALSRLENPLFTDYTSAVSAASMPASGVKSAVPSSPAHQAAAASAQFDLPRFGARKEHSAFFEYYANEDGVHGARVTSLFQFNTGGLFNPKGKTSLHITAGWYAYDLLPKEETTWFLPAPYFSAGRYASFVAEAALRAQVFKKTPPLMVYAALGYPQSPFGEFARWSRFEMGVPIPLGETVLTFKGKLFYAGEDFYTPKNYRTTHRNKAAGNISYSFFAFNAIACNAGIAFGYDSYTELCKARAGFSLAAGSAALSVNGHFTGWKIENADDSNGGAAGNSAFPFLFIADSSTSAGYGASVSYIFAAFKPEVSASYKWFPGKNWEGTKEEYAVSLLLTPRYSARNTGIRYIPVTSIRYNATSYADSRFTSAIAASSTWKLESARIKAYAKVEASFPLQ